MRRMRTVLRVMHKIALARNFITPVPKEALAYFRAKGLKVGFNHQDVWKEEHTAAFTAAKVMEFNILRDLRGIVEKSIAEGTTFRDFQQEAGSLLDQSGWSDYGNGKSDKNRLKTIFDTNMRVARSAGQWHRVERVKESLPYLIYELGPSKVHRDEHVEWAGTILKVDDPWWNTHMTPNGFGCKCSVRQISPQEADSLGGVTEAPDSHLVPWENIHSGKTEYAPIGVDPAFAYNPGKNRMAGLNEALDNAEEDQ
jgi:uncharacterized protein with gpF-like domain